MKHLQKSMSIFIIFLFIAGIIYVNLEKYLSHKNLYQEDIKSKIIAVEYKGRGGYFYYYKGGSFCNDDFEKNRKIKFMTVGDSIKKSKNSLILLVYKKTDTSYKYYGTFVGKDSWW